MALIDKVGVNSNIALAITPARAIDPVPVLASLHGDLGAP